MAGTRLAAGLASVNAVHGRGELVMEMPPPSLSVVDLGPLARPPIDVAAAFREWLVANGHVAAAHCAGCAAYYAALAPTTTGRVGGG